MDYTLFKAINGLAGRNYALDEIMKFIAQYFEYLFGIALLVLWFKKDSKENVLKNRRAGIFAMISFGIAMAINQIIAHFYNKPRPYMAHQVHQLIKHSQDTSFPSDHASAAFALAFAVLFFNKRIGTIMIAIASVLIFSRVYVGVHYPFDVLAGVVVGLVSSYVVYLFSNMLNIIADFFIKIWEMIVGLFTKKSN